MQALDISWIAILKIMGAGAFAYVVLPALLVIRDLLLHKAIGKWVLTDNLNTIIMMCENDRWYLDNKYNKPLSMSFGSNGERYTIDNEEVGRDIFLEYEKDRNFHLKRFQRE